MSLVAVGVQMLRRILGNAPASQPEPEPYQAWSPGEGWHYWMETRGPSPYDHEKVEAIRESWDGPHIFDARNMAPQMNVSGLWWRPLGPMIDVTPRSAVLAGQMPEEAAMWAYQNARAMQKD